LIELPRGWLKSPRAVFAIAKQLRGMKFDIALDLQGLTKSALLARLSGAKRRLGLVRSDYEGRELSTWLNTELVDPESSHVVQRGLELLKPLGIEAANASFRLPRDEAADATAAKLVRERGLGAGFVIVNTGAGWPSKVWPAERYAAVARYLGSQRHLPTIVTWAGEAEQKMADQIIIRAGGHAQLAPPTSLVELAALARRARLFIGSDTGPLHIAAAVGTPCVGLYGPMPASRCGPYGEQHIALQNALPAEKLRNRKRASNDLMLLIAAEEVCAACDEILDRAKVMRHVNLAPRPHFTTRVQMA
jgi:ADP-heptose:LPS heptosyltransferase